ncbi:unnamed protein product [Schistosoma curassoni]|uniref:Uncharacterized protein n=1 Tax=Schistosoma curassoni TaxID=6186 RepID=A0A183L0Q9_9TREM|nr:unnamed protein product [Schistosoma curassoni]VDP73744.1 unnamed protein product [Schistosoma curassoni]
MDSAQSKIMKIKVVFHDLEQEREQHSVDDGEEDEYMDNIEPLRQTTQRKSNESLPTLLQRAQSSDSPFAIGNKEKTSLNKLTSSRSLSRGNVRRPSEISINDFLSMPPVLESIDAQRRSTLYSDEKHNPLGRRGSTSSEENIEKSKPEESNDDECGAVDNECEHGSH